MGKHLYESLFYRKRVITMKTIYKNVIVGIDDNDNERAIYVLNRAIRLARVSEAHLIVVSTIPYSQIVSFNYAGMDPIVLSQYIVPDQNEIEMVLAERKEFVHDMLQEVDTEGLHLQSVVEINDADVRLVELAKEHDDAVIVVGASDKKAIERLILGSVARQVLNTSTVDVLLVK